MDVAVTELRMHMKEWLERAQEGHEVVVTDRGVPVARLLGVDTTPTLERLVQEGVISAPRQPTRPTATGRKRPVSKRAVSEIITEQRG